MIETKVHAGMTGKPVVSPELVAHIFAVGDGPPDDRVDTFVRTVWSRCQNDLDATEPIISTGLPAQIPTVLPPAVPGRAVLVAAARDPEDLVQAVMRREHEVISLSVLLAARAESSWADFDRQMNFLLGAGAAPSTAVLGIARIYLGKIADPEKWRTQPLAQLGRAVSELAPFADRAADGWHRGLRTQSGVTLWEPETGADGRVERRLVVLAGPKQDGDLGSWAWSEGGWAAMPRFARYLMHVAKIRHQLRVRSERPGITELCRRIEDTLTRLAEATGSAGASLPAVQAAINRTITEWELMRRTVGTSWNNAVAALGSDVVSVASDDPIGHDRDLTTWFVDQLGGDAGYLSTFLGEAMRLQDIVPDAQRRLRLVTEADAVTEPDIVDEWDMPTRSGDLAASERTAPGSVVPLRVLAVADEWFPGRGGLSAVNRQLCIALAAAGAEVFCLVPSTSATERAEAADARVQLVDALAVPGPGLPELAALLRRPALPDGIVPDVVVGHSRVTGQVAETLVHDYYPTATRMHFVHTEPDQVEWHKLDREDDAGLRSEQRTRVELDLGRGANLVVAIGPRLDEWLRRDLGVYPDAPPVLRVDPGFDVINRAGQTPTPRRVPEGVPQILLLGRMEDSSIKGVDLAARAIGHAIGLSSPTDRWELLIRGAPEGQAERLRTAVLDWIGQPSFDVTVRNYSPDPDAIDLDLRRASLAVMPSRAEGFGLVGLEAIKVGTPVLVSDRSGLGMLLREVLPAPEADRVVVPVVKDDNRDVPQWGHRIAAVLRDRNAAFATAASVQCVMAKERTWAMAAKQLLAAVRATRIGS